MRDQAELAAERTGLRQRRSRRGGGKRAPGERAAASERLRGGDGHASAPQAAHFARRRSARRAAAAISGGRGRVKHACSGPALARRVKTTRAQRQQRAPLAAGVWPRALPRLPGRAATHRLMQAASGRADATPHAGANASANGAGRQRCRSLGSQHRAGRRGGSPQRARRMQQAERPRQPAGLHSGSERGAAVLCHSLVWRFSCRYSAQWRRALQTAWT
jgi:hypothetical protein